MCFSCYLFLCHISKLSYQASQWNVIALENKMEHSTNLTQPTNFNSVKEILKH